MSRNKPTLIIYSSSRADEQLFRRSFPQYEVVGIPTPIIDPSHPAAKRAETIAIHVASKVGAAQLKYFPKLKHIACRSTGYDMVDLKAASRRGVIVTNVPSYGEHTVAEYAILLAMTVLRRLPDTLAAVQEGSIDALSLVGHDMAGKTIGILGTGRIGKRVIQIARGFAMRVIAYDVYPDHNAALELGFEYRVLNDVLEQSDILSLHMPATKQNKRMINAQALARMKPSAILINTARGSLVHTAALVRALQSQQLAGAGLDVIEGEQYLDLDEELHLIGETRTIPEDIKHLEALRNMPQVILTSHNAYNTVEALQRIRETTRDNIRAAIDGHPTNVVH